MPTAHYTGLTTQCTEFSAYYIYQTLFTNHSHSLHYTRLCIAEFTEQRFLDTLGLVTEHQRTRLEGLLKVIKVKHKSGSWQSVDASFHLTT